MSQKEVKKELPIWEEYSQDPHKFYSSITNKVEAARNGEDSGMLWLSFALSPGLQLINKVPWQPKVCLLDL